ncbi:hypothetical protein ACQEVZ_39810 [Dactylosporangium sp. CA-152071]|uniref:hypothetical protein n=1 Tax=Dactylosporangium sp. CA-152071 TaxID=3239933 RepID=UPI003D8D1E49
MRGLLSLCPALRTVSTSRGAVIRPRHETGEVDPDLLAYANARPADGSIWAVLDRNLLGTTARQEFLTPFVAKLLRPLRDQLVIDAGAVHPAPSLAEALAAADDLAVPVELPAAATVGVDEVRLEYRDGLGRPTLRPFAVSVRVLPRGVDGGQRAIARHGLRRAGGQAAYELAGGWVVEVFDRGLWVRPAEGTGAPPAELIRDSTVDRTPVLVFGVRGVTMPEPVRLRVERLRDALTAGLPDGVREVWPEPPRPEAHHVTAGVYLPPGGLLEERDAAEGLRLAGLLPSLGQAFAVVVHVRGGAVVWGGERYDSAALAAQIKLIAAALGHSLKEAPLVLVTTPDSDRWRDGAVDWIVAMLDTRVISFERLGLDLTVAEETAFLQDPGLYPAQPLAAGLHQSFEMLGLTIAEDAGPPYGLDDTSWVGPVGLYGPENLRLLLEPASLRLDRSRLPELIDALGIPGRGRSPDDEARWQHIDRLVRLSRLIGRVPDDLPQLAAEFGFDGPWSLYLLVQRLGVDPRSLRMVSARVRAAAPAARAGAGPLLDHLRAELADLGVYTEADLVWLLQLGVRHTFTPGDLAAVSALVGRGISLELLHDLPAATVRRVLDGQVRRLAAPMGPGALAQRWRLDSDGAVAALARSLRTTPEDLAPLYGEYLDAAVIDLAGQGAQGMGAVELAGWVRTSIGAALDAAGADIDRYLIFSGELGFAVTELATLPAGRHRDMLIAQTLRNEPLDTVGLQVTRIAAGRPAGDPPAHLAADVLDPAAVLGVRSADLDALGYGLDLPAVQVPQLAELALRIGRVPADLGSLAHRIGVPAATLVALGAALRTDPRHLLPFRGLIRRTQSAVRPDGIPVPAIADVLRTIAETALRGRTDTPDGAAQTDAADDGRLALFFFLISQSMIETSDERLFLRRLRWTVAALRGPWLDPLARFLEGTLPWLVPDHDLVSPPVADPFDGLDPYQQLREGWWARRLGVRRQRIAEIRSDHPALDLDAVVDLAQEIGATPARVLDVADVTGRVPVELAELAAEWWNTPDDVAETATSWQVAPHLLDPVRADRVLSLPDDVRQLQDWTQALALSKGQLLEMMSDSLLSFTTDSVADAVKSGVLPLWRAVVWGVPTADAGSFAEALSNDQLETFGTVVDTIAGHEGLDLSVLAELAVRLRVSRTLLAAYSLRVGRIPLDLADVARRLGVDDPLRLLAVASLAGVDVRDLDTADELRRLNFWGQVTWGQVTHRLAWVENLASAVRQRRDRAGFPKPARNVLHDLLHAMTTTRRPLTEVVTLANSGSGALPVRVLLSAARDLQVDPRLVARFARWETHQLGQSARRMNQATPAAALHDVIVTDYPAWAGILGDLALSGNDIWLFFGWLDEDRANASRFPSDGAELVDTWLLGRLAKHTMTEPEQVRQNIAAWEVQPKEILRFADRHRMQPEDLYATGVVLDHFPWAVPRLAAALRMRPRRLLEALAMGVELPLASVVTEAPVAGEDTLTWADRWRRLVHEEATTVGWDTGGLSVILADLGLTLTTAGRGDELRRHIQTWTTLVFGLAPDPEPVSLRLFVRMRQLGERWLDGRLSPADDDKARALASRLEVSPPWLQFFSGRIGRVPEELDLRGDDQAAKRNRRWLTLAAMLGVAPRDIPADRVREVVDAADVDQDTVVRTTAAALRADPVWSAAHPPEQGLAAAVRGPAREVERLGLTVDEWAAPSPGGTDRADRLARSFEETPATIRVDLSTRPWLSHADLDLMAGEHRVSRHDLRRLSLRLGRVPTDITELADHAGLPPAVLIRAVTQLTADPRSLRPLLEHGWTVPPDEVPEVWARWLQRQSDRLGTSQDFLLAFMADMVLKVVDLEADDAAADAELQKQFTHWLTWLLHLSPTVLGELRGAELDLHAALLEPLIAGEGWQLGDLRREAALLGMGWPYLASLSLELRAPVTGVASVAARYGVHNARQVLILASVSHVHPSRFGPDDHIERLNDQPVTDVAATLALRPTHARPIAGMVTAMARAIRRHDLNPAEASELTRQLADERISIERAPEEIVKAKVFHLRSRLWADRFAVHWHEIMADLFRREWLVHHRLVSAAGDSLPQDAYPALRRLALDIGRLPTGLARVADAWHRDVDTVLSIALGLGAEPEWLHPVLAVHDPDQPLSEQLTEWSARLDDLGHRLSVDRPILLQAMNDSRLAITWPGTVEDLRTVVDRWQATRLALGPQGYAALRRQAVFSLSFALRLIAAMGEVSGRYEEVVGHADRLRVSRSWMLGAYLQLGRSVLKVHSINDIHERLRRLADGPSQTGVLGLVDMLDDSADMIELAMLALELGNKGSPVDIDALPVDLRRLYFAFRQSPERGTVPLHLALLGRLGTQLPLPDGSSVRVVHAGDDPAVEAAFLDLYQQLPDTVGISDPPGAGLPFARALTTDHALTAGEDEAEADAAASMTLPELLDSYPQMPGIGRFLDADGRVVPGFDGIIGDLAATGGRGIALFRAPGAAGSHTMGVLNVFTGGADEVVFLDPLKPGLAELPSGDAVEVLFLPTSGPMPARFARLGDVPPDLDAVFAWPPAVLTGLGLDPADAGLLLRHAASVGVQVEALPPQFRQRYAEWWGAPTGPERISARRRLHSALLEELAGVQRLPGGTKAGVVHATSGSAASGARPALDAMQLLLLNLAGLRPLPARSVEHIGDTDDEFEQFARAFHLDQSLAGTTVVFEPENDEEPPDTLMRLLPGSGGFVRFLGPSGERVSGFDGVVRHLDTTHGRGLVMYRLIGLDGKPSVRLLNAFTGPRGEILFVDAVSFALADLPLSLPVDVLFWPTMNPVDLGLTESVDLNEDWADVVPGFHNILLPRLPAGARSVKAVSGVDIVVVGTDAAAARRFWETVAHHGDAVDAPLVGVEPDALATLDATLRQLRWSGLSPVVVARDLRDEGALNVAHRHGLAVVNLGAAGIQDEWLVRGPVGWIRAFPYSNLAKALQHAAGLAAPAPNAPPPELVGWLAADDWDEAKALFDEYAEPLQHVDMRRQLAEIVDRVLEDPRPAVFGAVLDLAAAGNVETAFGYVQAGDDIARARIVLEAALSDAGTDLLTKLIIAARRAEPAGNDADTLLMTVVDLIMANGDRTLDAAEEELLQCLDGDHRGRWLDTRTKLLELLESQSTTDEHDAPLRRRREALERLALIVVNC